MSSQQLVEIQEFKISFKEEFFLEYYRLMSRFSQFKRNLLKNRTSITAKMIQAESLA